jgi:hypothetical protein
MMSNQVVLLFVLMAATVALRFRERAVAGLATLFFFPAAAERRGRARATLFVKSSDGIMLTLAPNFCVAFTITPAVCPRPRASAVIMLFCATRFFALFLETVFLDFIRPAAAEPVALIVPPGLNLANSRTNRWLKSDEPAAGRVVG